MDQYFIFIFGIISVTCITSKNKELVKWGCLAGLCGEPFWIYTAYTHSQWGILSIAVVYGCRWAYAVYHYFIEPKMKSINNAG